MNPLFLGSLIIEVTNRPDEISWADFSTKLDLFLCVTVKMGHDSSIPILLNHREIRCSRELTDLGS